MNSRNTIFVAVVFAMSAMLFAQAMEKDKGDANRWLTKEQQASLSGSVPPPPAPGSVTDVADLAKIMAAQLARTPDVVAECKRDQKFSYELFDSVYPAGLTKEKDPKFFEVLDNVMATTYVINETAKNRYKRLRPYQGHPDTVKGLFEVHGFSYPSGHAMGSYTLAVVLGAIFPHKKQAFLDRAAQIAESRVNAGVHYPSDIAEGKVLGNATGAAILATSAFQTDLAAVEAELRK
jgi:acid phosphatase (class A)